MAVANNIDHISMTSLVCFQLTHNVECTRILVVTIQVFAW